MTVHQVLALLVLTGCSMRVRTDVGGVASNVSLTNATNAAFTSVHRKKNYDDPGHVPIVFPDNYHNEGQFIKPRLPEKLSKSGCVLNICEEVEDYPADQILNALRRSGKYDDYFNEDRLAFDITDRNNFEKEETLCQTRSHTTYPKTAFNLNKTERFIVNVDGYQQALVFETCMDNMSCKFSEMFPEDYETSCKQRYAIRRLMALNDDAKPAFDTFEVPSCCVCTYRKR